MKIRSLSAAMVVSLGTICSAQFASATVITLDFDTLATGSDIVSNPLVTTAGTITASAVSGNLYVTNGAGGGFTGDALRFDEATDGGYGQLAFSFDVTAITLKYAGFLSGFFTAEALDGSLTLVDSFFDGNTNDDTPGGPITLSGTGIRYLRFGDYPGGASFAGIDDVEITSVPEPGTLTLFGLALAGLGFTRRRNAS